MSLRLKLLQKWGEYGAGSVLEFGESKGLPLIAKGLAERTDEPLKTIGADNSKKIRLKLLKQWGEYGAGSVIDFGESKGLPLIAKGIAEKTNEALNKTQRSKKKQRPQAETAMMEPAAETAEVTPTKRKKKEKK